MHNQTLFEIIKTNNQQTEAGKCDYIKKNFKNIILFSLMFLLFLYQLTRLLKAIKLNI